MGLGRGPASVWSLRTCGWWTAPHCCCVTWKQRAFDTLSVSQWLHPDPDTRQNPQGISERVAFLPPRTVLRRPGAAANPGKPMLVVSCWGSECLVGQETWGTNSIAYTRFSNLSTCQNSPPSPQQVLVKTRIVSQSESFLWFRLGWGVTVCRLTNWHVWYTGHTLR